MDTTAITIALRPSFLPPDPANAGTNTEIQSTNHPCTHPDIGLSTLRIQQLSSAACITTALLLHHRSVLHHSCTTLHTQGRCISFRGGDTHSLRPSFLPIPAHLPSPPPNIPKLHRPCPSTSPIHICAAKFSRGPARLHSHAAELAPTSPAHVSGPPPQGRPGRLATPPLSPPPPNASHQWLGADAHSRGCTRTLIGARCSGRRRLAARPQPSRVRLRSHDWHRSQ